MRVLVEACHFNGQWYGSMDWVVAFLPVFLFFFFLRQNQVRWGAGNQKGMPNAADVAHGMMATSHSDGRVSDAFLLHSHPPPPQILRVFSAKAKVEFGSPWFPFPNLLPGVQKKGGLLLVATTPPTPPPPPPIWGTGTGKKKTHCAARITSGTLGVATPSTVSARM